MTAGHSKCKVVVAMRQPSVARDALHWKAESTGAAKAAPVLFSTNTSSSVVPVFVTISGTGGAVSLSPKICGRAGAPPPNPGDKLPIKIRCGVSCGSGFPLGAKAGETTIEGGGVLFIF